MEKRTALAIGIELEGMDEAIKKAERYVELLKEANTLAQELASFRPEIILGETQLYQNVACKSGSTRR
ncbi:hypothetical protein [Enterococcus sp. OL5]|uniref:hypothetical protein n=1 Tax=Enterococcus sp. OL5 TaxID=2590214 RepID=UPI00112A6C6E|nr:hypothetical protein [Enterococcus sp. OL5]TPR55408.1 hypothetical protein FJU10_17150 [Enterococcus sp. OL5]